MEEQEEDFDFDDYEICDSCETICPYCKNRQHYTGDCLDQDEETTETCDNCGKDYRVVASFSVSHHCYKALKEAGEGKLKRIS